MFFFFFLHLSHQTSLFQWHHEESNFFWEYGQFNCLFYVWYYLEVSSSLLNCRFHLFRSSASSFSSQYLLFLKSLGSCIILLLPTPFTSAVILKVNRLTRSEKRKCRIQRPQLPWKHKHHYTTVKCITLSHRSHTAPIVDGALKRIHFVLNSMRLASFFIKYNQ